MTLDLRAIIRADLVRRPIAYRDAPILKTTNPLDWKVRIPARGKASASDCNIDSDSEIRVKNPRVASRVGEYLKCVLFAEVEHGMNKDLIYFKKRQETLKTKFKAQFTAYSLGEHPFSQPPLEDEKSLLVWWGNLRSSPRANILAVSVSRHSLALMLMKRRSISPSSFSRLFRIPWLMNAQHLRSLGSIAHCGIARTYRRSWHKPKFGNSTVRRRRLVMPLLATWPH